MRQKKELTLDITGLTSEGQGVARLGRDVYFVEGALPGETVRGTLQERRRKVWHVHLNEIVTPSPDRITPACPHYRQCGGCDLQHLEYSAQVTAKQQRVEREFQRQGLVVGQWAEPIIGNPWHYRRRARLGVRYSKKQDRVYVGFREAGSEHLTNVQTCPILIEHPLYDWSAWQRMLGQLKARDLITQIETLAANNGTAFILRALKPISDADVFCLQQFVDQQANGAAVQLWLRDQKNGPLTLLWPDQATPLHQEVAGHELPVRPDDFVQVNADVNRRMVIQAIDWLAMEGDESLWDLFAGLGNFSVPLSRLAKTVVAVEGQSSMVESLQNYANQMALSLHAVAADLFSETVIQSLLDQGLPPPDKILLDPPRAGALDVARSLARVPVSKLVYVSCDPATLARDLEVLTSAGYNIIKAGIMDMFPQTHHVETMVCLTFKGRKDGKSS